MDETVLARIADRLDALETKLDAAAPWSGDAAARASVDRLVQRLDRIEALVDAWGTFAERLPVIGDAAGSMGAWAWAQAEQRGVDPLASGLAAAELGVELGRAENLALVQRLLRQRAVAEAALEALDGVEPAAVKALVEAGAALLKNPAALGAATAASTALVQVKPTDPPPTVWGMLQLLVDGDVHRALAYGLTVAKRFGTAISRS